MSTSKQDAQAARARAIAEALQASLHVLLVRQFALIKWLVPSARRSI